MEQNMVSLRWILAEIDLRQEELDRARARIGRPTIASRRRQAWLEGYVAALKDAATHAKANRMKERAK